jgi:two-component system, chemotaxis family, CheB/CheR fusion protein
VGLGGSAGGLKAFEQFFFNMPPDTGMAFVLLQHLDPIHKCILPELIQRKTKMKVFQIEDGMKVQPNCIYVIPPNHHLSIQLGILKLLESSVSRSPRMPIDFFFSHLAEDQGEKSICIIFSGMGTDGTLGLKKVKGKLGMVMVQDPDTAEYNSMPLSALSTNLVDFIAPAEELPAKLIGYVKHLIKPSNKKPVAATKNSSELQKIFILIRNQTGHDFSLYKKNTLYRRIERRISVLQIDNVSKYVSYLQQNPQEVDFLFNELLIGVTNFFREPETFEFLKENVIPNLLRSRMKERLIRIWIPGCSTGEEVYSIAIILRECLERIKQVNSFKVCIFATDINKRSIEIARKGTYPVNIAADVSQERLAQFFIKVDNNSYQIKKAIREMVVFAPQNIIMDPPFIKLDMLSCRNLLIYFSIELQKKLFPIFHYSLNSGGILFLGSSETIGEHAGLFSVLNNRLKIFKRKGSISSLLPMIDYLSPTIFRESLTADIVKKDVGAAIPDMIQRILRENYTPPAVVINESGDIIYISGKIGKYLEPSPGKANLNVFVMAKDEIRFELGKVIREASSQKNSVTVNLLNIKGNDGFHSIKITVRPFPIPENPSGLLMIIFEDTISSMQSESSGTDSALASEQTAVVMELEGQLTYTREHLQSIIEEMETSQEELKSMNEEFQLTNEELQSANEELKTSREELQSLNEELITVNFELQTKNNELSQSNSDMKNLLSSTRIATIFLDNNLKIKRFTPEMTSIINLIQTDVGRPISDIVQKLKYSNLIPDVREVLDTLVYKEAQVKTTDGNWFNMRIFPYRTIENVIDGVVITFNEITKNKILEESLTETNNFTQAVISTVKEPMIVLNDKLMVVSANRSFYKTFMVNPQETENLYIFELGNRQWNIPALRDLLDKILSQNREFNDFLVEHEFPVIGHKKMLLNARRIFQEKYEPQLILLAIEDITNRKQIHTERIQISTGRA